MESFVGGTLAERSHGTSQAPELVACQLVEVGVGRPHTRSIGSALELPEQREVARAFERSDQLLLRPTPLASQLSHDRHRRLAELSRVRREPGEQHVEVARRRQLVAEPLQLFTQALCPLDVEQRTSRTERRTCAPGRNADLMDPFRIVVETRYGIVARQLVDLLAHVRTKSIQGRRALLGLRPPLGLGQLRLPVRHDREDVLALEHRRLDVAAVATRPGLGDLDELASQERSG